MCTSCRELSLGLRSTPLAAPDLGTMFSDTQPPWNDLDHLPAIMMEDLGRPAVVGFRPLLARFDDALAQRQLRERLCPRAGTRNRSVWKLLL